MIKGAFQILMLMVGTASTVPAYFLNFRDSATDTSGFVLVKKSNGIELYERWDSISTGELAREVKAVFQVKTNLHAIPSLIRDETKGMEWNNNSCIYKVLEKDGNWICNIQYDLPWPLSNQDCVLQYREVYLADELVIGFRSIDHPLFPSQQGVMRIHNVQGKWVLTQNDGGIKVEYFISTTPVKTLPKWITDPIIRNNLIRTMIEFREILEKGNK